MRLLLVALAFAVTAGACTSDAGQDFNEHAVKDFLDELHFAATDQLAMQMLADARDVCTARLDDHVRALIKVSVGQRTDRILRAGCPGRVNAVMAQP